MSLSPPSIAFEMHSRPTRSAPSVWKYCLMVSACICNTSTRDSLGIGPVYPDLVFLRWIFTCTSTNKDVSVGHREELKDM